MPSSDANVAEAAGGVAHKGGETHGAGGGITTPRGDKARSRCSFILPKKSIISYFTPEE
jgi:hypothetical protein